jgi:hypothetical protein
MILIIAPRKQKRWKPKHKKDHELVLFMTPQLPDAPAQSTM